jgi:hypothetical protein
MSRAKALYPETKDFMAYQGYVLFGMGIATLSFIFQLLQTSLILSSFLKKASSVQFTLKRIRGHSNDR